LQARRLESLISGLSPDGLEMLTEDRSVVF